MKHIIRKLLKLCLHDYDIISQSAIRNETIYRCTKCGKTKRKRMVDWRK